MLLFGAGTITGTGLVQLADLDLGVDVTRLAFPYQFCYWSIDTADHGVCSADAPHKRMSWLAAEHDVHSGLQ